MARVVAAYKGYGGYQHRTERDIPLVIGLGREAERALGPGDRFAGADAGDPGAVALSVAEAADHLGGLDVLVNNAAIGVTARLIDRIG